MTWPAAVLAIANIAQVCVLAWLAGRQQQVKRDLTEYNGRVEQALARSSDAIERTFVSSDRPA